MSVKNELLIALEEYGHYGIDQERYRALTQFST